MGLFAGDGRAGEHHDVEVMNEAGKVPAGKRLPEGAAGMSRLHGLIGRHVPGDADDAEVVIGIQTGRGPWGRGSDRRSLQGVPGEPAAGLRYRGRHAVSGAKSDGTRTAPPPRRALQTRMPRSTLVSEVPRSEGRLSRGGMSIDRMNKLGQAVSSLGGASFLLPLDK